MNPTVTDSLSGLYAFLGYFTASSVLLILFCVIYLRVTPYPELRLVKEGRTAPAISFGGAVLGFVIPMASAISQSVSFLDMLMWALVALVIQILVFVVLRVSFPGLVHDIAEDRTGSATVLALFSVAAGILNAASMTW